MGFDLREGLTLHQIELAGRPVIYRASIPEMVVPYGDPQFRYWQSYFDTGEYLVGKWVNSLELGCDSWARSATWTPWSPGRPASPGRCATRSASTRRTRHPLEAHRHLQRLGPVAASARAGGVVLHHRRQLRLRLLLVLLPRRHDPVRGQDDRGGVHRGASGGDHPYSTEVAPGLGAPVHQHLFNARLDMSVDGLANAVEEVDVTGLPIGLTTPTATPSRSR